MLTSAKALFLNKVTFLKTKAKAHHTHTNTIHTEIHTGTTHTDKTHTNIHTETIHKTHTHYSTPINRPHSLAIHLHLSPKHWGDRHKPLGPA